MDKSTRKEIEKFVNMNIGDFHSSRLRNLQKLNLDAFVKSKNPYLFRAKNVTRASEFIDGLLQARISSSEETKFGSFLEELAIFVCGITCGGQKSATTGIDIDLRKDGIRYLIAVKSGKNWSNASSMTNQRRNFKNAVQVLKQSKYVGEVQPTLGICYGNFKTANNGLFLHIGGQSFWNLLSGDDRFYVDIVEPIGHQAEEHAEAFKRELDRTANRLHNEFFTRFCDSRGEIDWSRLVHFVSGNLKVRSGG